MAKKITKPTIYTEEWVLKEVKSIIKDIQNDKELTFKGSYFEDKDYSIQRYSEWKKAFENDEISETIKKIDEIFRNRRNEKGAKGELNPTMCIWLDKVNDNKHDKTIIENHNHDHSDLSDEDLDKRIKELE